MADAVYEIVWIESESGWGQKEWTRTYHETKSDADRAMSIGKKKR